MDTTIPTAASSSSSPTNHDSTTKRIGTSSNSSTSSSSTPPLWFLISFILLPITISVIVYQLDPSNPVPYPNPNPPIKSQLYAAPPLLIDHRVTASSDLVASGELDGPEDLVYDEINGWIYTGCGDGWIKRVKVVDERSNSSSASVVVEKLVNTGGRPLGLALSRQKSGQPLELYIADAEKGLLKLSITNNMELVVLTTEAEGQPFKLTDGVDVAKDGTVYFTDASWKYGYKDSGMDNLEGRPYGRLLSYEPLTGETKVLLKDLYFPNGVAVSHDQNSVVFCETPLRRCTKYYIKGRSDDHIGKREAFVDDIPGSPDNIHYDSEHGLYWIGLYMSLPSPFMNNLMENPIIRKGLMIVAKYIGLRSFENYAGVFVVDLEGNPVARLYDARLSAITSGIRIGEYVYCGSIYNRHILRLNLTQYDI